MKQRQKNIKNDVYQKADARNVSAFLLIYNMKYQDIVVENRMETVYLVSKKKRKNM